MKKLENYGLVELNATEIMNIDGGYGWGPIFTCIYGIPAPAPIPVPKLDIVTFEDFLVS
jgi:hypothetical protein